MSTPTNLRFATSNEWVKVEENKATIGISDYAQNQLSDIVFAEIVVALDDELAKGDTIATIESVKAAADVYSPVSGRVIAVNEELAGKPEVLNSDPYGVAWMIKVELSAPDEVDSLMDAASYDTFVQEQE